MPTKPRIAVFSGPFATIQNSQPLVTSNKARQKYGLPPRTEADGGTPRFDALRPQRLAAPVKVYVEQFSAHPLEGDAAELYAPPDGYLDESGAFHPTRQNSSDVPVYEITLQPEDGLYPLPYMGRQANGQAWEQECAFPWAPEAACRQTFYPDAARIFEEIDRLGVDDAGQPNCLSSKAEFDFIRAAPSGGYKHGLPESGIEPEVYGRDFFAYRPYHLRADTTLATLCALTNITQAALDSGAYDAAIWLEGSPHIEETIYWLSLLLDTGLPLAGNSSQRPHGAIGNDGDRNIVDAVDYIVSRIWAGEDGADRVGPVVIVDEVIYTAREVQKVDARPGGYRAAGGHGGIVGSIGQPGPPVLTFVPVRRHTRTSEVNLRRLPASVAGLRGTVAVKDGQGRLLPEGMPLVNIVKPGHYHERRWQAEGPTPQEDVLALIDRNLREAPLAGFVCEGLAPYGNSNHATDGALRGAILRGMPVVSTGRGNAEGFTPRRDLFIGGSNLTSTKARLLLMAALLKLGSLPAALDPANPTPEEMAALRAAVDRYQEIFDSH